MEPTTMKKKFLVTGGAGFIGSHVTELLCDLGHDVCVIDDLSFGYKKFVDRRATFIHGSIGDKKMVENALEDVDVVIHLAASSIIKFSFEKPQEYYENNVTNGIVLLEAMRKKHVNKIIFSSTAAVYGIAEEQPIKETTPKSPITIYGSSKLAFEYALQAYYHSFGIESVSLRYFNAYGPRDEQQPVTRAVPAWIQAILHNETLPVYWKGRQLRDYIFVKDIAQAHIAVLETKGCTIYNIGCGKGIWMKDIFKTLEKISGKKLKTKDLGERNGDPAKLVADISKIKKELGWQPKTSLKKGLTETFKYYQKTLG